MSKAKQCLSNFCLLFNTIFKTCRLDKPADDIKNKLCFLSKRIFKIMRVAKPAEDAKNKFCFHFKRIGKIMGVAKPAEDAKNKFCFHFKRIFKIRIAKPADDIKNIFAQYSENGIMTIDHLHRFLTEHQKESNATKEDAQQIFNSIKHRNNILQRRGLNLDAFFRYLLSDLNTPLPSEVHHDMDAPLSHYYMYTSCINLTGNQVSRASSIDTIVKALRRGVRVIELDLWPTFDDTGVEVFHEMTLTSPADLNECLRAIKDNAFVASEYPVIINFQLHHLIPDRQDEIGQMVTKTFGDMLYYPDYSDKFPSPNSLKRRILISITKLQKVDLNFQVTEEEGKDTEEEGTNTKEEDTEAEGKNTEEEDTQEEGKDTEEEGKLPRIEKSFSKNLSDDNKLHKRELIMEDEDEEKAAPEYRKLIAIHTMKLKGGSDLWPTLLHSKVKRLSISHKQLPDWTQENEGNIKNLMRFTQRNILSVYPNDLCVGSSNYNPCLGWFCGAQMVTLNMQGTGKCLSIMQGLFRANGGCGYVKKPSSLLQIPIPIGALSFLGNILSLKIKIYHGEGWHLDFPHTTFDRYSPPNFFVKIRINGVPADEEKKKTKPVMNQWVPNWNEEFELQVYCPELAVLRIKVLEYDKTRKLDFAAQTSLPASELKKGIRAIPLYNKNGDEYKHTRLLMRFEISE